MFDKNGNRIKATVVLSVPRLMFTANFNCILNSIAQCGFRTITAEGVYYDQTNSGAIKQIWDSEFLVFVDYDAIYSVESIKKMFEIMLARPEIDMLVPIQISRHNNLPLCFNPENDYESPVAPIEYGHFGCTIIRSKVFKELPEPWFWAQPNKEGKWEDGKIDADSYFWKKAKEHGFKAFQANEVCIGHMELFVKWPNGRNSIICQPVRDLNIVGMPKEAHYGIKKQDDGFNIKL